ncbi:MAG TPA: EF-hand domain-containing protein [Steroidobacter sp.]|uniref:EF-hand domain-containing protein n=1 Tax=Steroidobacter sp. TaxID=1978227 RepID=UPI002ED8C59B
MEASNSSESRHPASERELKEEFVLADRDRDGRIDFEEFVGLMEGLEAGMSRSELRIGFHEIDTDADHLIDFREFADWWRSD